VSVRVAACYALLDLGDNRATDCLGQVLSDDRDVEVRKAAAYALGWLRDHRGVQPLLQTLRNVQEDAEVRGMAAEQLGRLEDPLAVPELRHALLDERPEVRFWAAYALGSFASSEVIGDLEVLANSDTAAVPGQGSVRDEALEAIDSIRQRDEPSRQGPDS
jgi:HEAT repeat protein